MTDWTTDQILELTGAHPVYLVTDVRSNRIVCRRVRRKGNELLACERKMFAKIDVQPLELYQDCRKNVFRLVPQPGTPFYDALQNLRGKL